MLRLIVLVLCLYCFSKGVIAQTTKIIDVNVSNGQCFGTDKDISLYTTDGSDLVYLITEDQAGQQCVNLHVLKSDRSDTEINIVCKNSNLELITNLYRAEKNYFAAVYAFDSSVTEPSVVEIYKIDKTNLVGSRVFESAIQQFAIGPDRDVFVNNIIGVMDANADEAYYLSLSKSQYSKNKKGQTIVKDQGTYVLGSTDMVTLTTLYKLPKFYNLSAVAKSGALITHSGYSCKFKYMDLQSKRSKTINDSLDSPCLKPGRRPLGYSQQIDQFYYYPDDFATYYRYNYFFDDEVPHSDFQAVYKLDFGDFDLDYISLPEPLQHEHAGQSLFDGYFSKAKQYTSDTANGSYQILDLFDTNTEAEVISHYGDELVITHTKKSNSDRFAFTNTPSLDATIYSFPACSD